MIERACVLVLALLVLPARAVGPAGSFTAVGPMVHLREAHAMTLLADGRVLVTGGFVGAWPSDRFGVAAAEIYDPASRSFAATADMVEPRAYHSAVLLRDGRVLVAGAAKGAVVEIYDPAAGKFAAVGSLIEPQTVQTATVLSDGRVLLAGETHAELFDPASGRFARAGAYVPRPWRTDNNYWHPTATLLPDGRVLLIGDVPSQLYDPASDRFAAVTQPHDACDLGLCGLYNHTATLLDDGRVLVAGGRTDEMGQGGTQLAELFDPLAKTFTATARMVRSREQHTAVALADGRVLVAGGSSANCRLSGCTYWDGIASTELYDPITKGFMADADMTTPRRGAKAVRLADGAVLIAGGAMTCEGSTCKGPGAEIYKLSTDSAPVVAREYYNALLDHYFVTAEPAEIRAIERGDAGMGWAATGETFTVWSGTRDAAFPVCRFYAWRPNSHFYTVDAVECARVKADPGWAYEGVAFYAMLVEENGTCVAPLKPLWRAYHPLRVNHRYSTNRELLAAMSPRGWSIEGPAMCVL